jgi:hypothetical protein
MVRFQADADLNQAIVAAVLRRTPAVDFRTAEIAQLRGMDDLGVLAIAAREGRVLVTHDSKTMPRHFGAYITAQRSAGVIVVPQHMAVSAAADELLLIWTASSSEDWANRICYLPL